MEEMKVPIITGFDNETGIVYISNYADEDRTELLDTYSCQLQPTPEAITDIVWTGKCR